MRIAVVILNWNGKELLERFLPSVVSNSLELATIYLADNASTDDSLAYVKQAFPSVNIIAMPENTGYAGGYNQSLSGLTEDLFILLNSDVRVTEGWLDPIKKAFVNDNTLGAAQPKILDVNNPEYFEYAGAAGGFIDAYGYPYCRGRIFESIEKDHGQYDQVTEAFWASGACLCIRRDAFNLMGGFDTDFFAHMEEIDLCWRLRHYGFTIGVITQSKVYHLGGGTLPNMHAKKTYLNFRNSLFILVKNVAGFKVGWIIFLRLILDGIAGFRFLLTGKPAHCSAVIRAHIDFYRGASAMRKKGSLYRKRNKYFKTRSIVWQYFIARKREFGKL
ncbi:MAG: glycosyltransferase family 2 protein [Gilvibacter sp.]